MPAWALTATVVAGLALAGVVAFLVVGVRSGPIRWVELLSSPVWDPARRRFGATAMIWGTVAVAGVAVLLAAPLGWASAVAINEVVAPRWRRLLRAACEQLAVVPSIVYGLIGIAFLRPLVAGVTGSPGGDTLLTGGLILAVMVLPTVVAISIDALAAVPASAREAAAACGLTRMQIIRSAVVPHARRGLAAALLVGLARALGETIAVFLLVGRADGVVPSSPGAAPATLARPGQTLTTKLNGPESVLAGTSGPHWAALCALGLLLLAVVAALTLAGQHRAQRPLRRGRRQAQPRLRAARTGRALRDRAGRAGLLLALCVPLLAVAGIGVAVVANGAGALHPSFWWRPPAGASGGGVRDQLVGTVLLVSTAGALAAPVGLGLGLVISEYSRPRASRWMRTLTLTLGGVPSILLGLWGYWLFSAKLGWGKSWLAGAVVLAVMALPVVVITVTAAMDSLPPERREAALAAGLRRDQVVRSVLVPRALPGLVTGLLLGLARAAGETAPILFCATVFAGASPFPGGLEQSPVTALPTHIFNLAQDAADPAALGAAWSAALVLILVAGLLVLAAAPARRRIERWAG